MLTYRCVELDSVLGDHGCDAFVGAIAAVISGSHDPGMFAPPLFHGHYTMRHVQFEVAA